jgi:hypothetical protein
MAYELRRLNRFLREFDKLTPAEQQEVLLALEALIAHLNSRQSLPKGLGIKKLTRHHWEVRPGLSLRIVYDIEGNLLRGSLRSAITTTSSGFCGIYEFRKAAASRRILSNLTNLSHRH